MPLHCLKDVMQFLHDTLEIRDLVSEYVKFILLTISTSTSNERSFSYLKSYLRSTIKQKCKSYCNIVHLSRNSR